MTKYDNIIAEAAREYRIPSALIRAIIRVESNWDPNAKRYEAKLKDTSYGLMQVLTKTARWISGNKSLGAAQLKQPSVNILVGTRYLRWLWDKYNNLDDTIASYNAGRPRRSLSPLKKYVNQGYVSKVKLWYRVYQWPYTLVALGVGGVVLYNMNKK